MRRPEADVPVWLWALLPIASFLAIYGCAFLAEPFFLRWVDGEWGLLENAQVLVLACAVFWGIRTLIRRESSRGVRLWILVLTLGCLYIAGEEISWGQHYFGWATPGWLEQVNRQGETNLHNITSWFDQKPRFVLEMFVIFAGIVLPLHAWWTRRAAPQTWLAWMAPASAGCVAAVLTVATRLPQRLSDLLPSGGTASVVRHSEIQEYFIYLFLLIYVYALHQRVRMGSDT